MNLPIFTVNLPIFTVNLPRRDSARHIRAKGKSRALLDFLLFRKNMVTIAQLWVDVNDYISLHGTRGCTLHKVFDALSVPDLIRRSFAAKLRDGAVAGRYTCKQLKGDVHCSSSFSSKERYDLVHYQSTVADFWKAIGIEGYAGTADDIPLLIPLLEVIGIARDRGVLLTEASHSLGVSSVKLYTVVERGAALAGVIVKRNVYAAQPGGSKRINSRTVILHLKRFEAEYDPITDGVCIEADDHLKVDISRFTRKLIVGYNRRSLALSDVSSALGCDIRTFRAALFDGPSKDSWLVNMTILDEKNDFLVYPGRGVAKRQCISIAGPSCGSVEGLLPSTSDDTALITPAVIANAALYEQTFARLRWSRKGGIVAHRIRQLHCLLPKRSERLFNDLKASYGFPVSKRQFGKQAAYVVLPLQGCCCIADGENQQKSVLTSVKSERVDFILRLLQKKVRGTIAGPFFYFCVHELNNLRFRTAVSQANSTLRGACVSMRLIGESASKVRQRRIDATALTFLFTIRAPLSLCSGPRVREEMLAASCGGWQSHVGRPRAFCKLHDIDQR